MSSTTTESTVNNAINYEEVMLERKLAHKAILDAINSVENLDVDNEGVLDYGGDAVGHPVYFNSETYPTAQKELIAYIEKEASRNGITLMLSRERLSDQRDSHLLTLMDRCSFFLRNAVDSYGYQTVHLSVGSDDSPEHQLPGGASHYYVFSFKYDEMPFDFGSGLTSHNIVE